MRVTPIIVVPASRETRETKLPWYSEFVNGPTTYLVSRSLRNFREASCEQRQAATKEKERNLNYARGRANLDRYACRFLYVDTSEK